MASAGGGGNAAPQSGLLRSSDVGFISSLHGAQRREQREISKRDLQAAVKYGVKERGYPNRKTGAPSWKYTFEDIVYITDETSTFEITSRAFELPIESRELSSREVEQHEEAKRRIKENPRIITSHHVMIVDMSSSMRSSDNNGHRTRFRAVYYSLAEQFTAQQIEQSGLFTGTDVVTLVEMRDDATVVFELEPVSWVLFNKFVELALQSKFAAHSHGNYIPSFEKAAQLLLQYDHEKCAPSLFFLSDGRPSDESAPSQRFRFGTLRGDQRSREQQIMLHFYLLVTQSFARLGSRLIFHACGYGSSDFTYLEGMVAIAKATNAKTASFLITRPKGRKCSLRCE